MKFGNNFPKHSDAFQKHLQMLFKKIELQTTHQLSNSNPGQVRKIIARRETSFYRRDAKPVLKRREVHVQLKAISVSASSNHDHNKTGEHKTFFNFSGTSSKN